MLYLVSRGISWDALALDWTPWLLFFSWNSWVLGCCVCQWQKEFRQTLVVLPASLEWNGLEWMGRYRGFIYLTLTSLELRLIDWLLWIYVQFDKQSWLGWGLNCILHLVSTELAISIHCYIWSKECQPNKLGYSLVVNEVGRYQLPQRPGFKSQ